MKPSTSAATTSSAALFAMIAVATTSLASVGQAFHVQPPLQVQARQRQRAAWSSLHDATSSSSSPFFDLDDDDDCDIYEEHCERNWDFGTSSTAAMPTNDMLYDDDDDDERDVDMQPLQATTSTATTTTSAKRVHLEMKWQMDECSVQPEEACEDFCPECSGSGKIYCHFCRGTKTLVLNGEFKSCPICCETGMIDCDSCRGTGFIAPWASTMDEHLADSNGNKKMP